MSGFAFWCLGVFVGFSVLAVGLASLKNLQARPAALMLLVLVLIGSSALLAAVEDRGVLSYPVGLLVALGCVGMGPALLRLKRWRKQRLLAFIAFAQLSLTTALLLGSAAYLVPPAIAEAGCQRPIKCETAEAETSSAVGARPSQVNGPK